MSQAKTIRWNIILSFRTLMNHIRLVLLQCKVSSSNQQTCIGQTCLVYSSILTDLYQTGGWIWNMTNSFSNILFLSSSNSFSHFLFHSSSNPFSRSSTIPFSYHGGIIIANTDPNHSIYVTLNKVFSNKEFKSLQNRSTAYSIQGKIYWNFKIWNENYYPTVKKYDWTCRQFMTG